MKFGQNLPRNQVPEWARSYIDYKALKKLIKTAQVESEASGAEPDLATFFYTLDRQLEDVDTFYNQRYAEVSRRLRLLYDRYGVASKMKDGLEKEDLEDLMGALLELRGTCRKLQWYGEVNRRGFVKITKKLDKKIESSSTQNRYLATRVDPKQFATNNRLTMDMRTINEWLSSLAEVKVADDASSVHSGSSHSLRRIGEKGNVKIPSAALEAMDAAVRKDENTHLMELFASATANLNAASQNGLLLDLLQRAVTSRSYKCIDEILGRAPSIDPEDDMNRRNCLHRIIIATGRSRALENSGGVEDVGKNTTYINPAQHPVRAPGDLKVEERDPGLVLHKDEEAKSLLSFVIDHLRPSQRSSLISKDIYGRTPLHYAAQYGLASATQLLMSHMQEWKLYDFSQGIDSPEWQDEEGYAPLHLAVIGGHYRTSMALLMVDGSHKIADHRLTREHVEKSSASLVLATKSNYHKIVKLLVDAGVDVNFQDESGETALHVAARFGHEDCARALLTANAEGDKIDLEIAEKTYAWTPLFIACVNGHLPIVKLLIDAGAEPHVRDSSSFFPQEHAALRGHLEIARYLASLTPPPSQNVTPDISAQRPSSPPKTTSLGDKRSQGAVKDNSHARVPEPVKSFGHRYLTDETMILVSLGTLDEHKNLGPIDLDNIAITDAHSTQLDTALSLVVSAQGASGDPQVIDLPIQDEISTSPITFTTRDPSKVKLLFDLVPTYAGSTDKVIARAVALLSSIKMDVGTKRMSLQTDLSVPLVAGSSLEVIGSINFNFLIITPFQHPKMSISAEKTYWTKSSTQVIGHRGLGKNMATKTSLQLGENTIQSFITAANLGASYVEFDVQMTKDHVPVIYHDFLVSETGADVPVHSLTLEQFLALSQTPGIDRAKDSRDNAGFELDDLPVRRPQRSYSLGGPLAPDRMKERMKHTRDFRKNGFKPNTRGDFIHSPFTTLEEMLRTLPEEVGFNIEMKYPMLFESVAEEMDTYAVELNSFVDTVLALIYDLRGGRNIVFSSFHPDICLLLTFKQPSIPVLFLTDAGSSPVGDIRASSLQEAIRFAHRWNLLGIVANSEPFVLCPRLISVVQSYSLVCISWGSLNNDPANATLQAQAGIDAVIVDSVARVRKGLTEAEYARAKAQAEDNAKADGKGVEGTATPTVNEAMKSIDLGAPVMQEAPAAST